MADERCSAVYHREAVVEQGVECRVLIFRARLLRVFGVVRRRVTKLLR